MTDAKPRAKRLRPEDFTVNEDRAQVNLGYDVTGRTVYSWDVGASKNLLLAGYGVRQTEWELASIVSHFKHYGVPTYGLDFSDFISNYPKGTFTKFTTQRGQAEELLAELAAKADEFLLVISAGGNLLAPTYIEEALRPTAEQTRERILDTLGRVLENPVGHVVFATSRLYEEAALPTELLGHFPTYVLTSKILTRDRQHIARPEQDQDAMQKVIENMSAQHSVLVPMGAKAHAFENFRTRVR